VSLLFIFSMSRIRVGDQNPGGGVPMVILSGKLVAQMVNQQ